MDILKEDRKDSEARLHIGRQDANEILKKGLSLSEPSQGLKIAKAEKIEYAEKATELQLAIERWALASPARLESARRAFQSHVRAYATHVAAERRYFDIKELHLGHLAKAFALRERPSGMKVPGLRTGVGRDGGKGVAKAKRTDGGQAIKAGGSTKMNLDVPRAGGTEEEAAKMRKAVRAREKFMRGAGVADEFNLG